MQHSKLLWIRKIQMTAKHSAKIKIGEFEHGQNASGKFKTGTHNTLG
jgi:hypothetical protein